MSGPYRILGLSIAVAATLMLLLPLARAASPSFEGELDPVPFDNSTRANVAGIGTVKAVLDRAILNISGDFSGLSSAAVAAHLHMGRALGVPGPAIGELTLTHGPEGRITGKVKLDAAELTALRANSVYVQLESVKSPDGALWGWLESANQPRSPATVSK